MHLEEHSLQFEIDKPDQFRDWVNSPNYIEQIEKCGGNLKSLKEVKTGIWDVVIEIDKSNPRSDELVLLSGRNGYQFTLRSIPVVRTISSDAKKTLNNLEQEIKKVKEDLLSVT